MKVELVEIPTEITDASIKQYLADCSSVVRNKQPKDNDRLFDRLLKESYGAKPSRVFEYIPCVVDSHIAFEELSFKDPTQLFGFIHEGGYHTTARELLNWGWSWDDILMYVDFTHYKTVKVEAPYFLYGQASTHNQITSVSHSNRYTEADLGYWKPPELDAISQEAWNDTVKSVSPTSLQEMMKQFGVTRREVFARGADMLANRVYTLGGYTNNPNAWEHFINQRALDKHTQLEMRILAQMIKETIENE